MKAKALFAQKHCAVAAGFSIRESEDSLRRELNKLIPRVRITAIIFLGNKRAALASTEDREGFDILTRQQKIMVHRHQVSIFKREPWKAMRVHIANLPGAANEAKLMEMLSQMKTRPISIVVLKHDGGRCKGYAFATFQRKEKVERLLKFNNLIKVEGRPIRFQMASDKRQDNTQEWIEQPRAIVGWKEQDDSDQQPTPMNTDEENSDVRLSRRKD